MGYHTEFKGYIKVDPPLNSEEIDYLNFFSNTRHMVRDQGEYYADGLLGANEKGVIDFNRPPQSQPGLWCDFIPTDDGSMLVWNEAEKTYNATEWVRYLIDHFLKPGAEASKTNDPLFRDFTFNHVCNGQLDAHGEYPMDVWAIMVTDNEVAEVHAKVIFSD